MNTFETLISYIEERNFEDFENLDWVAISTYKGLSEEFMGTFRTQLNWRVLCTCQKMSEEFIEKHIDLVDLKAVFSTQKERLSPRFVAIYIHRSFYRREKKARSTKVWPENESFESVIEFIQDKFPEEIEGLDWTTISSYKGLTESFIETWAKYLNWNQLVTHQKLSEVIIRKFIDKLNAKTISTTHLGIVSLDFLFENKHVYNLKCLKDYKCFINNTNKLSFHKQANPKFYALGFADDILV